MTSFQAFHSSEKCSAIEDTFSPVRQRFFCSFMLETPKAVPDWGLPHQVSVFQLHQLNKNCKMDN